MLPHPNNIELRSEEFQEILGKMPNWIIRSGIGVVFLFLISLLALSGLIKYPEKIQTRVVVTTRTLPASSITQTQGRLKLFVNDNQRVVKNQLLAYIDNPANYDDVLKLIKILNELPGYLKDNQSLINYNVVYNLQLGELQASYLKLIESIEENKNLVLLGSNPAKSASIVQQVASLKKSDHNLANEENMLRKQRDLTRWKYSKDSMLFVGRAISLSEFNTSKNTLLESERARATMQLTEIENKSKIKQLESQLTLLNEGQTLDKSKILQNVYSSLKQVESDLEIWKAKYLLFSPINGSVSFVPQITERAFVNQNQEVFKIVPSDTVILVNALVPLQNSGRVKRGQEVLIKLDNYPYEEFGMVIGTLDVMSLVPVNGFYTAKIKLKKGLISTQGNALAFKQEMQGSGEIITNDASVFNRIFYKINSLIN